MSIGNLSVLEFEEMSEEPDSMTPLEFQESTSLYTFPATNKFTFDVDNLPQSHHFSNRIANALINTRCSERCKFVLSAAMGCLAVMMQIPPIFLLNWVVIDEPKTVNQTDDQGEHMEAQFVFNLGYFGVCRTPASNMSNPKLDANAVRLAFPRLCVLNPFFTEDDLSDYSFAATIILHRLAVPAVIQISGTVLNVIALLLSIVGEFRCDKRTIVATMFYVTGGLFVFVAVLQVICAVDDEMYPRMKPLASGLSFLSTSLSFLPLQVCVYFQTNIYFGRFPLPSDVAEIVPGLTQMINETMRRSQVQPLIGSGPSSACSHRRDSRCSREFGVAFGGVQQEVQRLPASLSVSRPSMHICI
ncbi:hypothetical protein M3Y98_00163100 [Aphelenchoides besseyi]|nr:hypothetical protein M3Y98_00163100 [Aphelenchoides besseyi]KAI6199929.1 hypothetical protein M3Y96_00679400 [Aphelenchoides besseyi]